MVVGSSSWVVEMHIKVKQGSKSTWPWTSATCFSPLLLLHPCLNTVFSFLKITFFIHVYIFCVINLLIFLFALSWCFSVHFFVSKQKHTCMYYCIELVDLSKGNEQCRNERKRAM